MHYLKENEENLELQIPAPGINKQLIEVKQEGKYLTVEVKEGNMWMNAFKKVFNVSDGLNTDDMKALYQDGVLSITIPKKEGHKPRKIEIV